MYSPKPGHWPSQQQYLNINSGCHATENSSEETISKSSQIRELIETVLTLWNICSVFLTFNSWILRGHL